MFEVLEKRLAAMGDLDFGPMSAREFILYQSQLSPNGSKYTQLQRFPLQAATCSAGVPSASSGQALPADPRHRPRAAGEDAPRTAAKTAALQSTAVVLLNVQMNTYAYFIIAAVSYLLGSIPFGYLLVRIFKGEDVRASGSGNIGATNVARKSPALGIATLLLDAAKGLAAVLVARVLFRWAASATHHDDGGIFAVLGHLFPVWLKFRGGKGVATSLGAFILLTPKSILCMVVLFLIVAVAFRYISLGSVAVAAAFPLLAWALREYADSRQLVLIALVSALVIWRHRQNIGRLAAGTESKFGTESGSRSETSQRKVEGNPETESGTSGATHR